MKTSAWLLLAATMLGLPLTLGCWQCEGGPQWERYATLATNVTLGAATPVSVPLRISAPVGGMATDTVAVEIATDDCAGGSFDLGVRLVRGDGTELAARDGVRTSSAAPTTLRCPSRSIVFRVPTSELTCAASRCTAAFTAEITSETGAGPRRIEAHLVHDTCSATDRSDAALDGWGT